MTWVPTVLDFHYLEYVSWKVVMRRKERANRFHKAWCTHLFLSQPSGQNRSLLAWLCLSVETNKCILFYAPKERGLRCEWALKFIPHSCLAFADFCSLTYVSEKSVSFLESRVRVSLWLRFSHVNKINI